MHTVELFERASDLARDMGYEIRKEWLGGSTGGRCEFGGRKWIFIDLSLSQLEQLDQLREAVHEAPELMTTRVDPTMERLLDLPRRAA